MKKRTWRTWAVVMSSWVVNVSCGAGLLALSGCVTDEGVAGGDYLDGTTGGSDDAILGDGQVLGDTIGADGTIWTDGVIFTDGTVLPDGTIWTDGITFPDSGPIGCVSDANCPSGPCSKSACDPGTHQCVVYQALDGSPCGAGSSLCGTSGVCQGGQCTVFAPSCNDSDPCTADQCDPASGKCLFTPIPGCAVGCYIDAQCEDGDKCTQDQCLGGVCTHLLLPGCGGPGCATDAQCEDGDLCTQNFCAGGQCVAGGIGCAVSDPCTIAQCNPKTGQCEYTPIPNCGQLGCTANYQCDDGLPCSIDTCVYDATGMGHCQHVGDLSQKEKCCDPAMNAITCYDGNACTQDYCGMDYQCQYVQIPGCGSNFCKTAQDCDDFNGCTIDACTFGTGKCVHKIDLNQPYCCDPTSSAPSCNDGDTCTQDMCGPDGTCQYLYIPGCSNIPKCKSDADCATGDICTLAKCDVGSGVCLYGSIPNCCDPKWCDDGNPCTADVCTPQGGCSWTPIPGCGVTYCKMNQDCSDGDPCTYDVCDVSTATCYHKVDPTCGVTFCKSSAECNDFDNCTGDLCLNNQCAHKTKTCDDGNPCTADQCNGFDGSCSNAPVPGCIATPCQTDKTCDDGNACTFDSCPAGWCTHAVICDGPP